MLTTAGERRRTAPTGLSLLVIPMGGHASAALVAATVGRSLCPSGGFQRMLRRICRGSACTCQLLKFYNVINSRQPCAAFVNFLSTNLHFLLCIVRCFCVPLLSELLMRFSFAPVLHSA
jgi:hypothetical protein